MFRDSFKNTLPDRVVDLVVVVVVDCFLLLEVVVGL